MSDCDEGLLTIGKRAGVNKFSLLKDISTHMEEREKGISLIDTYHKQIMIRNDSDKLLNDVVADEKLKSIIPDAAALSIDTYPISGVMSTPFYATKSKKWHLLSKYNIFIGNGNDFADSLDYNQFVDPANSGLHSYVFVQVVNDRVVKVAYVFRGTINLKDWKADGEQGVSGTTAQYSKAYENAKKIKKSCEDYFGNDVMLYFFGHSLGGGLAMYCAIKLNCPAITFNAASVNPVTIWHERASYRLMMESNKLISINLEGEFLSSRASNVALLPKPGYRVTINRFSVNQKKMNPGESHKMEYICSFYGLTIKSTKSDHYI